MSIKLGPLKTSPKRKLKELKEKQNKWVLDCINEDKSKLKPYSSIKDKYLKYFVVRVPKKKKMHAKNSQESESEIETVNSTQFQNFLQAKKQKILKSSIEGEKVKQKQKQRQEATELKQICANTNQNPQQIQKQKQAKSQCPKPMNKQQVCKMDKENDIPAQQKVKQNGKNDHKELNKQQNKNKAKQEETKLKQAQIIQDKPNTNVQHKQKQEQKKQLNQPKQELKKQDKTPSYQQHLPVQTTTQLIFNQNSKDNHQIADQSHYSDHKHEHEHKQVHRQDNNVQKQTKNETVALPSNIQINNNNNNNKDIEECNADQDNVEDYNDFQIEGNLFN